MLGIQAVVVLRGYLMLRLGLTAPISFAEGRVDFARSWRLTKGRTVALLGMWALTICLFMLVWVALYLVIFVTSGLMFGFHGFGPVEGREALRSFARANICWKASTRSSPRRPCWC